MVQEFREFASAGKPTVKPAEPTKYEQIMENIGKNPHPHGDAYMDYVGVTLAHGMKAAQPLTEGPQQ